ncbi:redoxin domain-containing protein [Paracoccus sp. R12_1]|jgi:peroxiredoxin|uniref:redoxin domain-containing protein n=1 Tax=unclassified Paracoccus (in: a-proteobacteria) TaxID=2688777 RepID=UPI001ADC671F|nr:MULTISPECIES: redoxin domain-containing protein [unclassified Paracoccus (in: a-proteobacteria)]MBO9455765.1 redoxin domain-containing protein [Paracoccus sp. R12_2]MBO9487197.1 redoxin domain-containing protein [Paracoccus sp. R12_1]
MTHTTPMPATAAPAIDAKLADGAAFTLPSAPDGGMRVVFFYRGVHCPICKTQIEELASSEDELRAAGLTVAAVSMDDRDRFARQVKEWDLGGLTVGHALTEASARDWGLYLSDKAKDAEPDRFAEPGIAVLKADDSIYAMFLQNTPVGRPRLDDLLQGLGFVMKNDYPVRGTA